LATVSQKAQWNKISRQMAPDDLRLNMYSVLLVLTRWRHNLALATPYRLNIADFPYPLSFSALDRGDPCRIYRKTLRSLKKVFDAADGEDLVIVAGTVLE